MEKHLIEATADGVATLTINRPDRLNALSTPIMERSDAGGGSRFEPPSRSTRTRAREIIEEFPTVDDRQGGNVARKKFVVVFFALAH